MNIKKLIDELNKKLSLKFDDFDGIYFYGSRVKGDYQSDSDFDMVILFKDEYDYQKERELAEIIIDIELEYDIFIDHHPMTANELEKNPIFYNEVVNKGQYYAAA